MSHFSVLVVLDNYSEEALKAALQPYHEYECTGVEDQYVIDVDKHDEAEKEFAENTTKRWKDTMGRLHDPYDDKFYRNPRSEDGDPGFGSGWNGKVAYHSRDWGDGRGYRAKVHMTALEAGCEEVQIPTKDIKTIDEWAKDYHGWERNAEGRFVDRTNPNAKWDWWQVGGRYSGKLQVRTRLKAAVGQRSWTNETAEISGVDISQWHNLDIDAMRGQQVASRQKWIDSIITRSKRSREEVYEHLPKLPRLHERWLTVPEPRPRGKEYRNWIREVAGDVVAGVYSGIDLDSPDIAEGQTTQQWIDAAEPLSTWAVLKDGEWYEKGEMGWWGMSSGDKADHKQNLEKLFASIRPDQWVVIVDCHI